MRSPDWIDPSFTLPAGRRLDASYTFDGRLVVSDRFRSASKAFAGARFLPLPSLGGWYLLVVTDTVPFDAVRRATHFGPVCQSCHTPSEVAGALPAFLTDSPVVRDAFFRTDVEFGFGDELGPLVVIGRAVGDALAGHRLTGLELHPIAP